MRKISGKKTRTTITISVEAHEKMLKDAFNAKPRRTIRAHVNVLNNLPKEL